MVAKKYRRDSEAENKIVYALDIMRRLVERGHIPLIMMPNPTNPRYNCWVFKWNEKLQEDLDKIFEERERHGRG